MDCGPAALKALLEGFGVSVSYGRLREACQTDVDGTSIDMLEVVANQLGLVAEQVMVPVDHLLLPRSQVLPAIVVVKHKDGSTHFVVAWRRHGDWVQVMDPAVGRRWVRSKHFAQEVFRHATVVPAAGWREWASTADFSGPLLQQMGELGATASEAGALLDCAWADPLWFGPAALEASVRFVRSVVASGGLRAGPQAWRMVYTLFTQTHASTGDIFHSLPPKYWSVEPDATDDDGELLLTLKGAVLIRVGGRRDQCAVPSEASDAAGEAVKPSPELLAALQEKPMNPLATLAGLLRQDGLLGPWVLCGVMGIAAAVVMVEVMLFRGLFDVALALNLPSQRTMAMVALMVFVALLMAIEVPVLTEAMRYGRHLDVRLRTALLDKLPQLSDRYFQSRPVSDMADRSHSIHMARMVPGFGLQFIQVVCDLVFTLLGIALIDLSSVGLAATIAGVALLVPALLQPLLNERDLRVRNHAGALHVFNLDALLGLVPVRTHGAERVVRRQHEGLLVEWTRSRRGLIGMSLGAQAVQSTLCLSLVAYLLGDHFSRVGQANGADLLLVYWAVKLPALGQSLIGLAQQYPAQRNVLLRLLEPLSAASEALVDDVPVARHPPGPRPAAAVEITSGKIVAAGHTVLEDLNLNIASGEHVAIVGSSGAGKSTLLGLLLGWHRLAEGRMLLDGTSPSAQDLADFRQACAWVDPAIQIWNASFQDNVNYASEGASHTSMGEVLAQAQLRRVLQRLPQGLQTYLGEGGGLLSGGEGQRVRLARALMQSPVRMALLDEPFRGLDRTQRHELLQQSLLWWKDATVLCVTHDVAETLSFQRVLVIEGGRIVEDGAPAVLAASSSRYRELLDAETTVRERMWQGDHWRRVRVGRADA